MFVKKWIKSDLEQLHTISVAKQCMHEWG